MTDNKWHWLKHKWSRWQPYNFSYDGGNDVRQRRNCEICGFLQDKVAACDALLPPPLSTRLAAAIDSFGEKESKADRLIKAALLEEVESMGRDGEC